MAKKTSPTRSKTTKKAPAKNAGRSKAGSMKKTTKKVSKTSKAAAKPAARKSPAKKSAAGKKVASKKKVTTKTAAKTSKPTSKTASKKSASKKAPTKKKVTNKTKATGKKPATRKAVGKAAGKKVAAKKTTAKKTSKKTVTRKATPKKAAGKKVAAKKTPAKKAVSKKTTSKKPVSKKVETKKVATTKGSATTNAGDKDAGKGGRKGITVVPDKSRQRPRRSRPKPVVTRRPEGSQLLAPGAPKRAPLIPSGPSAPKAEPQIDLAAKGKIKCPFKKRELDKFRQMLINKRRSLVGDVSQLEDEALKGNSGNLSHTPSHQAEQGSDSADQSLSLGLAAADRRLINEIDDALKRIDEGKFGICEMTGEPIRAERLAELPWARYTIAAARERERNMFRGNW